MKLILIILFLMAGCNSEQAGLTAIQGMRDPRNPLAYITDLSLPSDNVYLPAATFTFNVTFSEVVEVSGSPQLGILTDKSTEYANYLSGSGTTTLTFAYTIPAGVIDSDGITFPSPLITGGRIFTLEDDDNADLSFSSPSTGIQINGADATLQSITVPVDDTYIENENLDFVLNFDAPVFIGGASPSLIIDIGGTSKNAIYHSGSGSTQLRFRYTLEPGLNDNDGIQVVAGISNGGSIQDAFGDSAIMTINSSTLTNVLVDSEDPTITLVTAPADATYYPSQVLSFTATFSEAVNVNGGTPRLAIHISATTKYATMTAGNGTNVLTFEYTIQAGDNDLGGISMNGNLQPNGATITDDAGNSLSDISFAVPATAGVKVDGVAPSISNINTTIYGPSPYIFRKNTNIDVVFTYNSTIHVTGSPYVNLNIGGTVVQADYVTTAPSSLVTFRYTVEPHLLDTDGVTVVSAINLNGGTMKDGSVALANNAPLTFTDFTDTDTRVNSFAYVTGVSVAAPGEGSYRVFETINLQITFNEAVTVSGTPQIAARMGAANTAINFDYFFTAGNTLTFQYTVGLGDLDLNGLDFPTLTINLNGGSIKDATTTNAHLEIPDTLQDLRLYLIPSELAYWLDVGDDLSRVNTGSTVTSLNSKADAKTSVSFGTNPTYSDDGVSYLALFPSSSGFDYGPMLVSNVILVYKAPPDTSVGRRLFEFGATFLDFETDGTITTCAALCTHYDGGSWVPANGIPWTMGEKRIFSFQMPMATQNFVLAKEFVGGEISEVLIFSSPPSASDLAVIHAYLEAKHSDATAP